jgi:hypothetical protein
MTRRTRISVSVGLLSMSVTAVATAASTTATANGSSAAVLLTAALVGVVLTFLVWSDELDRSSLRRSRAVQRRELPR